MGYDEEFDVLVFVRRNRIYDWYIVVSCLFRVILWILTVQEFWISAATPTKCPSVFFLT